MNDLFLPTSFAMHLAVQLAVCIATLYAFIAFVRAMQTHGEIRSVYWRLCVHLLEPFVTLLWFFSIGMVLWIFIWLAVPMMALPVVTLPMVVLLWGLLAYRNHPTLGRWIWQLIVLGVARWIVAMLYLWPSGIFMGVVGATSTSAEHILAIIVASASIVHIHFVFRAVHRYVQSTQREPYAV